MFLLKSILKNSILSIIGIDDILLGGGIAALGGGISAAAQLGGAGMNAAEQEKTNQEQMAFNDQERKENQGFQEAMSSTAYQRATADMKAAGINPMLAYMQGGASSPSGSSPTTSLTAPQPGAGLSEAGKTVASSMQGGLSTALQLAQTEKDFAAKDSQIALNTATAQQKMADRTLSLASAKKVNTDQQRGELEKEGYRETLPAIKAEAAARTGEAGVRSSGAEIDQRTVWWDKFMSKMGNFFGNANSATQVLRNTRGTQPPPNYTDSIVHPGTGEVRWEKERNYNP